MGVMATAVQLGVLLCALVPQPGKVLLATFDEHLQADRNDWGAVKPLAARGFRLTAPGSGCPANPAGRALDAGYSDATRDGLLFLPLAPEADLRQGTIELWVKPAWPTGERKVHGFLHIKLAGGYWNSIWLGYHGTISPTSESLGSNIMDGTDHPAYVNNARRLGWKAGEWHHLAVSWTAHSEYLFLDGRLAATVTTKAPFMIGRTEGKLAVGCSIRGDTQACALVDEVRLSDVPLYSPQEPPQPARRLSPDLGLGLATLEQGAKASADSVAAEEHGYSDVPELHDGKYGRAVPVGLYGQAEVMVRLPRSAEVAAFEWSRDGTPYAGEGGRGWAQLMSYPADYTIEASDDGLHWRQLHKVSNFIVSPQFVATHQALRFRESFAVTRCRFLRMVITRGWWRHDSRALLDEVAVLSPAGENLARLPGVVVSTTLTSFSRRYEPSLALDGRCGDESCWKSARPGRGTLTIELPGAVRVSKVAFSRSRDERSFDGVPSAGRIELSRDGKNWTPVGEIRGARAGPREVEFEPRQARLVRLLITATADGKEPVLDDVRVY
ncbi:MAG: discoidin domain-containing protein [Armatimonadetes bacterium]|nr:discoidin domain-containing protein [Armatimonadota bacterium]